MLPGSFCNADTMNNLIEKLKDEFNILAVDYKASMKAVQRNSLQEKANRRKSSDT